MTDLYNETIDLLLALEKSYGADGDKLRVGIAKRLGWRVVKAEWPSAYSGDPGCAFILVGPNGLFYDEAFSTEQALWYRALSSSENQTIDGKPWIPEYPTDNNAALSLLTADKSILFQVKNVSWADGRRHTYACSIQDEHGDFSTWWEADYLAHAVCRAWLDDMKKKGK